MKCPICNSPLRDGAVFCPYCGTRVGRSFEFENEFANQGATGEPQEEEQTNPYQFEGVREETSPEDFEDFDVDNLMDEAEAAAVIPDRTEQELKDLVMDVSEPPAPEVVHTPAQTPFTAQIREAADLNEEITIAPNAGVAQPSAMELLKSSREGEDIYQTRFGVPSKSQEVIGGMQEQTASEIARKMARAQQMQQTMGAATGMTAAQMLTNMNRQQAEEAAAAQAAAAPATPAMPAKPEPPLTAQEMLRARQEAKAAATQEAQEAVPAPEQAGPVIPETIGEADVPAGPVLPEAAQPEMMQETPAAPGMGAAAGMAAGAAAGVAAGAAVTAAAAGAAQAQGAVQTGSVAAQIAAGMIPEGMTAQQAAYLRQQQQMQQMFLRQQQQMQQQGAPAMPQYGYPYAYPYPYNPYAQGQMNPMQAADATAAGIAAESEESAAVFAAASGRQVVRPEQPQGAPAGARTVAAGTVAGAAAGMAAGAGMTQAGAAAGTGAAGAYPAAAGAGMGASVPPYGARPDAADSAEIAMAAGKGAGADGKGKAAGKASKKTLTKKNAAAAGGTGTGDVDEQDKEKKQRTAIYILAAVVGILVIIAFVIFFRRMRGGNVTEPAGTELAETAVTDGAAPAEGEAGEMTGDGTGTEAAPEEVAPTDQIDSLIAQGDFEEAIRMIDEAYRLNPSEDLVTYYTMAYRTWSDALLAEGDYETAIRQLEEASRIDADNEDVKAATVRAYRDWAEMFIQNSEYEEAIAKLDAAALKTSDESVLTEDYVRAYLAWGQYYETEGDIEQALNVLNQGYGKTSSNDIARRYNELAVNADGTAVATGNGENASGNDASGGDTSGDDTEGGSSSGGSSSGGSSGGSSSGGSSSGGSRGSSSGGSSGGSSSGGSSGGSSSGSSSGGSSSSGNNIGSFLTNIATASQSNNTSNVASNMRDSSFRSSAQSLINQYNGPISYDTSGTSVGVYPVGGSLMAYVGNYSTSNLRTGAANWYDVTGSETYVAKGSWSNDAPNGSFTATWAGSNYEVTYSGNVKNGLWDGPVNISWTQNGSTMNYTANATNGLFTQIGTDQNGYPMIAKNGDQGISVTQSELSTPAGIRGYGYAQVQ